MLRLTKPDEQGPFILKPVPNNLRNRGFCPANEHLTVQIVSQVYGILTPLNGLCFIQDGSPAYFVCRFDMLNGNKLLKEDFASLGGLTRKNRGDRAISMLSSLTGEIFSRRQRIIVRKKSIKSYLSLNKFVEYPEVD